MAGRKPVGPTEPEAELRHLVEEVGLLYDRMGVPRMAGRILGWLLIADPAEPTMRELADSLDASMASISTMTRLLEEQGLVERLSLPGERRVRYRLHPDAWLRGLEQNLARMQHLRQLGEKGLAIMGDKPTPRSQNIRGLLAFSEYFVVEIGEVIDRYRTLRSEGRLTG